MATNKKRIFSIMHLMLPVSLSILFTVGNLFSVYSAGGVVTQDEASLRIHEAALATEQAWEEFHTAAIQGTLASPLIQVTIEGQLHQARGLLMKARIAKRSRDYQVVYKISKQIKEITQNIVQASQERKQ